MSKNLLGKQVSPEGKRISIFLSGIVSLTASVLGEWGEGEAGGLLQQNHSLFLNLYSFHFQCIVSTCSHQAWCLWGQKPWGVSFSRVLTASIHHTSAHPSHLPPVLSLKSREEILTGCGGWQEVGSSNSFEDIQWILLFSVPPQTWPSFL